MNIKDIKALNKRVKINTSLHVLMLPAVVLLLIFNYGPMVGMVIGFQRFIPTKGFFGSEWVGLDNLTYLLRLPSTLQVIWNTVYIAFMKIVAGLIFPITFALLLNEVRRESFKKAVQTILYMPHFLSWVILSGIIIDILSPSKGIVNNVLKQFGFKPIFFLGSTKMFPYLMVFLDTWKELGFGMIIYLAALTAIDPQLYEAIIVDGANRWRQTWHITLPGMLPIIILMSTLSLGRILNAGFDQIFNLYSPIVYETGDILDTLTYRIGLVNGQYAIGAIAGTFKSVVSLLFIGSSYYMAYKFTDYRIF